MKKTITITALSLSALMILDTLNAGHAVVMFFLAGVIPGTNNSISATNMLNLFALLAGFTISRTTNSFIKARQQRRPNSQASNGTMLSAQS